LNTASISFPLFGEGFVLNPPAYFTIFGFNIYFYGLFITAGFALAAVYLIKRHEVIGLTKDNILDLVIIAVPCGLIGARIYYMVFNFEQYFGAGNWQNMLQFREGGLAVYGGIIASGAVFVIYSRIKKIAIGKLLDAAGFGLVIGQAVGRWGNFFNREAFGIETGVPWRMGLTFERSTYIASLDKTFSANTAYYFHPAFLYEMLWNVAGLVLMHIFSKKSSTKYPGQYFLFYVAWYGLGRFMIERIRVDSLFIHGTDIRVSQWLALLSCLVAVALLVRNHMFVKPALEGAAEDEDSSSEIGIRNSELSDDGSPELSDEAEDNVEEPENTDQEEESTDVKENAEEEV
jgi:phosphatidylglycerol:prolipoprotein diacylglycerol transferase